MSNTDELREQILHDARAMYTTDTDSPIIVQIPIDDLMQLIHQSHLALTEEATAKAMAKFGLKKGLKYDIKASDKVIVITPTKIKSTLNGEGLK